MNPPTLPNGRSKDLHTVSKLKTAKNGYPKRGLTETFERKRMCSWSNVIWIFKLALLRNLSDYICGTLADLAPPITPTKSTEMQCTLGSLIVPETLQIFAKHRFASRNCTVGCVSSALSLLSTAAILCPPFWHPRSRFPPRLSEALLANYVINGIWKHLWLFEELLKK